MDYKLSAMLNIHKKFGGKRCTCYGDRRRRNCGRSVHVNGRAWGGFARLKAASSRTAFTVESAIENGSRAAVLENCQLCACVRS